MTTNQNTREGSMIYCRSKTFKAIHTKYYGSKKLDLKSFIEACIILSLSEKSTK